MSVLRVGVRVAGGKCWLWRFPDTLVALNFEVRNGHLPFHLLPGWTGPQPDVIGKIVSARTWPDDLHAVVEIDSPTEVRLTAGGVAPPPPKRHPVLGHLDKWKRVCRLEVRDQRVREAMIDAIVPGNDVLLILADAATTDIEGLHLQNRKADGDEAAKAFASGGVRVSLRSLYWPMRTSPAGMEALVAVTPALVDLRVDGLEGPLHAPGLLHLRIASEDLDSRAGGDLPRTVAHAVVSPCWSTLLTFELHGANDDTIDVLAAAPVPARLRSLALPDGAWRDDAAERLAVALRGWPSLESLDVGNGQLSARGLLALMGVTHVTPGAQRPTREIPSLESGNFFHVGWDALLPLADAWIARVAKNLAEMFDVLAQPDLAHEMWTVADLKGPKRARVALGRVKKVLADRPQVDPGAGLVVDCARDAVTRACHDIDGRTSSFWGFAALSTAVVKTAGTRALLAPGRPVVLIHDDGEAARVVAEVERLHGR